MNYLNLSKEECSIAYDEVLKEYNLFKSKGLKLDMSRGKPSPEQLDLSLEMMDVLNSKSDFKSEQVVDCRNYGNCYGILEIKEFISSLTGINPEEIIVGGNSSLSMMFDAISHYMLKGSLGFAPWAKQGKIKFLCPAPGYDRHFSISEYFGMEMITVPMTPEGPDMDFVEKIVSDDESVKGIWCVPKYSNPQGITYSNETVKRLANLKPAAKDFKIIWDNAYFIHSLCDDDASILNIIDECKKCGNENMPIVFLSTSKITFPGDGVAFMACSGENLQAMKKMYSVKTVGFDKVNQLRHLRFLKDKKTILEHMKKHRKILKPKFDLVVNKLKSEFKDNPIVTWTEPKGGYFVSTQTYPGLAKEVVRLCKEAGVKLTKAGAAFPYGKDPQDSNIRIAPTYPSLSELELAMNLFCICVKLAFLKYKLGGC